MGYLMANNNAPLSNATVQLRNTVSGQVEVLTVREHAQVALRDLSKRLKNSLAGGLLPAVT